MGTGRGYGESAVFVCICVCGLYLRVAVSQYDRVCCAYWLRVTKGIVNGVSVNVCVFGMDVCVCLCACLFSITAPEGNWAHL